MRLSSSLSIPPTPAMQARTLDGFLRATLPILLSMLGLLGTAPSAPAQPTVDGDLSDADYRRVDTVENSNDGFGGAPDVREIVYFADDANDQLYIGIEGALPTGNSDGIGLWLNFRALAGDASGTALGANVSGAGHYLDGDNGSNTGFKADFEVDYLFAMNTGGGSSDVFYNGLERVGGTPAGNFFGTSDQSGGTLSDAFFGGAPATFAFNNGGGTDQGFEAKIPYSALGGGVPEVGALQAFAMVVSSTASFSNETVPGTVSGGNPGFNPDFGNRSGGPYHGSKLFTTASAGNWTATSTWSDGVLPFAGADVTLNHDVTLNTDATIRDLRIASGHTFTASDGTGRRLTLKNGATLDNNGSFSANDGTVAAAGLGTVTVKPGDLTFNDLTLQSDLDPGMNNATVSDTLTIETGGAIVKNAPTYGPSSTLTYASGVVYGRNKEWLPEATSDPGYPENVVLTDTTTLDLSAVENDEESSFQCNGSLFVDDESELSLDETHTDTDALSEPLTVKGPVTVDGTLTLSTTIGGDLFVGGDVTVNGTFNGNSRLVELNGSTNQVISGSTAPTIDFFELNNGNGATLNGTDLTVANTLRLDSGTITRTGSETLTLSAGSSVRRSEGALGFDPSFGGNVSLVYLAGVTTGPELSPSNLADFTVDASSDTVTLASSTDPTAAGNLTVTAGTLDANANTITLNGDATVNSGQALIGVDSLRLAGGSGKHLLQGSGTYDDVVLDESSDFSGDEEAEVTDGATLDTVIANDGVFDVQNNGATITGDLTANTEGTFQISGSDSVDVNGNVTVDGTLNLSLSSGGDLLVAGDFIVDGTVNDNNRLIAFDGSSQQTISGTNSSIPIPFFDVDNPNGVVLNTGVETSGTLTLTNGPLTSNGKLTLTSSGETNTAAIAPSGSGSVTGDVTFERFLNKSDNASHFRFLSAPTATKIDDEGSGSNAANLLSNTWTQSETGKGADSFGNADPSVFTYNEGATISSSLSEGWRGIGLKNNNNSGELNDLTEVSGQTDLDPGRGVLAYLFADRDFNGSVEQDEGFPITLSASGPVQGAENDGSVITPPITFTDNNTTSEDGWNLIANPFMAPIDWESIENDGTDLDSVKATIYVYDTDSNSGSGGYVTYTADGSGPNGTSNGQGRYIAPFQAFFVKATGSTPNIGGINDGDKAVGQSPEFKRQPIADRTAAEQKAAGASTVKLQLRTADSSRTETTSLRYSSGAAAGEDAYDAYQLKPPFTRSYALVSTRIAGTDALFTHQTRPVPAETDTVDLALDVTVAGTYVLEAGALDHVPADWRVILENVDTGTRYDLGAGQAARFTYEPGDTTSTSTSAARKTSASGPAARLEPVSPTVMRADSGPTAKASDGGLPSFRLLVGPDAKLPVELSGFDGRPTDRGIALSWTTVSETKNAGFRIERRGARERGGTGAWTTLGFVDGAGTTSEAQSYQFTDAQVPYAADSVAYRLRQVDTDGTTRLSETVVVERGVTQVQLLGTAPNPARQRATVRYAIPDEQTPESSSGQRVTLRLYDVLGRQVRTIARTDEAGRHTQTLDVRGLSPGVYVLRLQAGPATKTRKLVVLR